MRWFISFVGTVVGALIGGWPGAAIGFAAGCVIAALLVKSRSIPKQFQEPKAAVSISSQPSNSPNPDFVKPSPVDRLHEIMAEIQATKDSNARPYQAQPIATTSAAYLPRGASSAVSHQGRPDLVWHPAGQLFAHAGVQIDSGMLFTSDKSVAWPGEPSAIVTTKSVGAVAADPLAEFGYYPSYDQISPEQRRSYLEWLAGGRRDADPTQRSLGYLFIFFYGLERRIVVDHDRDTSLADELINLLQYYGPTHKSRSLRTYFLQLLHFAGWQSDPNSYRALWPRLLAFDGSRPDEDGLRFVLANLYQLGERMDWTIAYRVAMSHLESRRSAVIDRAQEKFLSLFEQRFHDHFTDGFQLQAAKQDAVVQYRPASGSLLQLRYQPRTRQTLERRIPNVAGVQSQFKPLPEIWNSCVDDLSGYSRALSSKKQGQSAALLAWKSLPVELRTLETHPLLAGFNELLGASVREGEYTFTNVSLIASLAGIPQREKLAISSSREIAVTIESLGWNIAPDPRITGLPLAWNQEVALYQLSPDQQIVSDVSGVIRLLYLAISIAAADGVIEAEETNSFYQLVASQVPSEADWHIIRATEASLRRDSSVALRVLPQLTRLIPAESRQFVLRLIAHIAAADGEVSLDELKLLRRIARAFQLDPDSAEKLIREDDAFREVVIAARGSRARGESIPSRPEVSSRAFALNQERIKALTEETHDVISLLSSVMTESDDAPCPPSISASVPTPSVSEVSWLSGLDSRYHAAVLALVRHDAMTSTEFDCLANENHLLPDDLFNAVNEWADETFGDFLLERADNVHIFRRLIPELPTMSLAA
jgi:tellurite resistance protein